MDSDICNVRIIRFLTHVDKERFPGRVRKSFGDYDDAIPDSY